MCLDLLLSADVCFLISINNTLLLKLIEALDHVVLTVPMGNGIVRFHGRDRVFKIWDIGRIDVVDKDASSVSVCGCRFTRDDVKLEVRIFTGNFVDGVFRIVLEV